MPHLCRPRPLSLSAQTPSDLAKLGIEEQKALRGESKLLSRGTALEMVAPTGTGSFAIGFGIEKRGEGWYFVHDGSNCPGFAATWCCIGSRDTESP
jgi:hypothetical protein